jgi:hypothetical protein
MLAAALSQFITTGFAMNHNQLFVPQLYQVNKENVTTSNESIESSRR